jgi:hypothetical protein
VPFTPFHMGPGVVVKAVLGRHFSLMAYGVAQVAMDLEPLVRLLRGERFVHGLSHTLAGATVIGLAALVIGRPICQHLLNFWTPGPASPFQFWLRGPPRLTWTAAATGAFVGTYSHIVLDAIMHVEMRPWWPLGDRNDLLGLVSMEALHLGCLAGGVAGLGALAARFWLFDGRRPS